MNSNIKSPTLDLPISTNQNVSAEEIGNNSRYPSLEPIENRIRIAAMTNPIPDYSKLLRNEFSSFHAEPGDRSPWQDATFEKPALLRHIETEIIPDEHHADRRFLIDDESVYRYNSPYLASRVSDFQPNEEELLSSRDWWYRSIPWKNLYSLFKQSSIGEYIERYADQLGYINKDLFNVTGTVVYDESRHDRHSLQKQYSHTTPESVLRDPAETSIISNESACPSDFGITLPAPMVIISYPSGSTYPLLPAGKAVKCGCPYRTKGEYTEQKVVCKHELALAFYLNEMSQLSIPVDNGVEVPSRCRRFLNPTIAGEHLSAADLQ